MSKVKDNFLKRYLPMWAKETVFADNKRLMKENKRLEQEVEMLCAYISGLEFALKWCKNAKEKKDG